MLRSNYVLSGRVHCAVPAASLNKFTSIMSVDSRSGVLTDFGVSANGNFTQPSLDLEKYFNSYHQIIQDYLQK